MRLGVFLIGIILFFVSPCMAQRVGLELDVNNKDIELEFALETIRVKGGVDEVSIIKENKNGQDFIGIDIGREYGVSNKIGSPELPVYYKIIEIPYGASPRVEIIENRVEEIDLNQYYSLSIVPNQPSMAKTNPDTSFYMDKLVYSMDEYIGGPIVDVEIIGFMGSSRLARLSISPVVYNPFKNEIRVSTSFDIRVNFEGGDLGKTFEAKARYYNRTSELVEAKLNSGVSYMIGGDIPLNRPKKMIILSDSRFSGVLRPYVEWKTEMGFEIIELYLGEDGVGQTSESIKDYLQNLWEESTHDNPPADYLLICGDIQQVPSFAGNTSWRHVTDLYYAEYTGDYLPELIYGRFPAQTEAQLTAMINKTIEYEKYMMEDDSYLGRSLLVAGKETLSLALTCNNGQMNYLKTNYLTQIPGLDTLVYYNPSSADFASQIRDSISINGYGLINYSAHCNHDGWASPNLSVFNINNTIDNYNRFGLYINNCCLANKFDEDECFGEAILRVEDRGGIGAIGGSNNTYWNEDFFWAIGAKAPSLNAVYDAQKLGAYDRWFHSNDEAKSDWTITQGELQQGGNLAVTQTNTDLAPYYWEVYHLMGDPSLIPYVGIPVEGSLELEETMAIGSNFITLNTEPFAYIGLSKDGALHGGGEADENGLLELELSSPVEESGYIKVVSTKQFTKPVIDSIELVVPDFYSMGIMSVEVIDQEGEPVSNVVNGKEYSLRTKLGNFSSLSMEDVGISLMSVPEIDIITPSYQIGNMASESRLIIEDEIRFRLKDGARNNETLRLELVLSAQDNYSVSRVYEYKIHSPEFDINNISISNPNNRYEVGDTITLSFDIENIGRTASKEGVVKLRDLPSFLTHINDSEQYSEPMQPEEVESFEYRLRLVGSPSELSFSIGIWADEHYKVKNYSGIVLGQDIEDFESNGFDKFDWNNSHSNPWIIDNLSENVFQGNYSARSGVIGHSKKSALSIVRSSISDDSISFNARVSSERNYDIFRFYIDGDVMLRLSGTHEWQTYSFPVSSGEHEFIWEYEKDYSTSFGKDGVWIDNISFPLDGYVTKLDEIINNNDLSLYPNPASSSFSLSGLRGGERLRLIDSRGVVHKTLTASSSEVYFDTDNLLEGVYYIVIESDKSVLTKKLIIAR